MKTIKLFLLLVLISGSGFGQANFKMESLKTFAKAYGYVKYFHPSDEAANIDWDNFAIYGSDKVEKCETKEQLLKTLNSLFLPIAPSIIFYYTEENVKFNDSTITPAKLNKYKTTYWQHLGVGLGMKYQNGIYKSIRVNRKTTIEKTSSESYGFGNLMTYLDAKKYKGKTIKLTGSVKLIDDSKGTGHLWLRVDKPDSQIGFFNNMDDSPITENVWKKYEITGEVDSMAVGIALGCFLDGSGELLVDDMQLFYKENEKWIEIPIKNSDFESEELGVSMKEKTWIYRGDEYEIKIVNVDSFEGKKCVSIKENITTETIVGKKIFDSEPAIGEVINKNIGSGISCIIPLVLYCDESNTYPESDKNESDSLLNTVNTSDVGLLSVRLGDIIIAWNVFQHFFPYFDVAKINWETELEKALLKCYDDKDENDFLITLQEFTAPLKDGHIRVLGGSAKSYIPPVAWEFIENKLVITRVCDNNLKLKIGDIVTQINGITPEKYFENIENRISAATPGWLAYRANMMTLAGDKDTKLSIVVNNDTIELIREKDLY
ncbi:MAG: peptidase S41, partial [Bacteroidota bacterium]